jgi:hypothetical protein
MKGLSARNFLYIAFFAALFESNADASFFLPSRLNVALPVAYDGQGDDQAVQTFDYSKFEEYKKSAEKRAQEQAMAIASLKKKQKELEEKQRFKAVSLDNMFEDELEPLRAPKSGYQVKGHRVSADEPNPPRAHPSMRVEKLKKKERRQVASVSNTYMGRDDVATKEVAAFNIDGLEVRNEDEYLIPKRPSVFPNVDYYSSIKPAAGKEVGNRVKKFKEASVGKRNNKSKSKRRNGGSLDFQESQSGVSSGDLKRELEKVYMMENQYLVPMDAMADIAPAAGEEDQLISEETLYGKEPVVEVDGEMLPEDELPTIGRQKNVISAKELIKSSNVYQPKIDQKRDRVSIENAEIGEHYMMIGNIPILKMKIEFDGNNAALTPINIDRLEDFSKIAQENPVYAIEISISEAAMEDPNKKALAARRLALVSNVLRGSGIEDKRIRPVLTSRSTDSFIFRIIDASSHEEVSRKGKKKEAAAGSYRVMDW